MMEITYTMPGDLKDEPMIAFRQGDHLNEITMVSIPDALIMAEETEDQELAAVIKRQV